MHTKADRTEKFEDHYSLIIRQQPSQGKAVGFRQYYGNFLNPPLILELKLPPLEKKSRMISRDFLCHVNLCAAEGNSDRTSAFVPPSNHVQPLIHRSFRGYSANSPILLKDPVDDQMKYFFIFPELAVKISGKFRFIARLIDFKRFICVIHHSLNVIDLVTSKQFYVHPARNYPGNAAPTKLTIAFADQGALRLNRGARIEANDEETEGDDLSDNEFEN